MRSAGLLMPNFTARRMLRIVQKLNQGTTRNGDVIHFVPMHRDFLLLFWGSKKIKAAYKSCDYFLHFVR
jgi:hypothetical protein